MLFKILHDINIFTYLILNRSKCLRSPEFKYLISFFFISSLQVLLILDQMQTIINISIYSIFFKTFNNIPRHNSIHPVSLQVEHPFSTYSMNTKFKTRFSKWEVSCLVFFTSWWYNFLRNLLLHKIRHNEISLSITIPSNWKSIFMRCI